MEILREVSAVVDEQAPQIRGVPEQGDAELGQQLRVQQGVFQPWPCNEVEVHASADEVEVQRRVPDPVQEEAVSRVQQGSL